MNGIENRIEHAALAYAARGWNVLPVRRTKVPYIDEWTVKAATDEETIRSWWQKWPEANVGILTGAESGIFVLDVDGEEGAASLSQLLAELEWEIPETLTVTTGRGTHFYFKYPGGTLGGKVGFRPGLDIRAHGNMVVGPPSIHRNGSVYRFVSDDVGIASVIPV